MPSFFRSKSKAQVVSKENLIIRKINPPQDARAGASDDAFDAESLRRANSNLKYHRLDHTKMQIRLLQVLPGQGGSPIQCAMLYTALRDKPYYHYETISYCWGTSEQKGTIEVDGILIRIGINAFDAIHRVRSPIVARVIWIDQICIDQNFTPEQNQQVANMGNVYRCARQNLIWLARDYGQASVVQRCLAEVLANVRRESDNFTKLYGMMHRSNKMFRRDGRVLDRRIDLRPLKQLFSSEWFGRLWIVQEVAMGRWNICHFGSADILLRDLLRVAVWLLYNTACVPEDIANMPSLAQALSLWYLTDEVIPDQTYRKITQSLPQVRTILRNFECRRPHDNVYALLGLFKVGQPLYGRTLAALKPEYERPVDLVFRDATRAIIEDSGYADILQSGLMKVNEQGAVIPSWVVDFRDRPHTTIGPSAFGTHFTAHNRLLFHESDWNGNPDVLRLRGVPVDTIAECTMPLSDATNKTARLFFAQAYELSLSAIEGTTRERSIELCSIFTGGSNWLRQPLTPEDFADFGKWLVDLRVNKNPEGYSDLDASHFAQSVRRACDKRKFFVTRSGRLGIGPAEMQKDDLVVVLFGCSLPLALHKNGDRAYKLLGGCYLYGIMKGEAVVDHKAAGRAEVLFDLV